MGIQLKGRAIAMALFMSATAALGAETSPNAECPAWLVRLRSPALAVTGFKDLCALYTATQSARARVNHHYSGQGLADPAMRLRGVYGPRLVDYSIDFIGKAGRRAHSDPWWIYAAKNGEDPTPEVFQHWQDAALVIDARAAEIFGLAMNGKSSGPAPFTPDFLLQLHAQDFGDLPQWGMDLHDPTHGFRQVVDVFGGFYRSTAYLAHGFDHLTYPVDAQGAPVPGARPAGDWHPVHCFDESPRELTEREEKLIFPNGRRDALGHAIPAPMKLEILDQLDHDPSSGFDSTRENRPVRMQCGYFTFAPVAEIPARVQEALENLGELTAHWTDGGSPTPTLDALRMVARLEHWLIGIHPFNDGNGRTIRLMADFLLEGLGLPTPIYRSTWNDLSYTEEAWAEQIAQGLERTEKVLEGCADFLEGKEPAVGLAAPWDEYCLPVPLVPDARPW